MALNTYRSKRVLYTLEQARTRVAYWQHRLRLTDWTITVEIVRAHKMMRDGAYLLGQIEMLSTKQMAVLRLLHPDDFQADLGFIDKQDMELTIIHELLHVRLQGMRDNAEAVRDLSEERAVHALSMAFDV